MSFKQFIDEEHAEEGEVKYHKDVYFPPDWIKHVAMFLVHLPETLKKSVHLKEERWWKDLYDISKKDLKAKDIFELAYNKFGKLIKVGFKLQDLDKEDDIVFIISKDGYVVTSWANKKSDTHKTLNKEKYATKWLWESLSKPKINKKPLLNDSEKYLGMT